MLLLAIQSDWSDYGIDWDEVSSANEDTTVILEDVHDMFTEQEVAEFHSSNNINGCDLSQELLLSHFESAKSLVYTQAT